MTVCNIRASRPLCHLHLSKESSTGVMHVENVIVQIRARHILLSVEDSSQLN